ncbi:MAG: aldose epimerase family protein [Pseudomonadota bacterium]
MTITPFGTTKDGQGVEAITLTSSELSVTILTLGAILNDVRLTRVAYPLTLGARTVAGYEGPLSSFGSFMGPVINRIKGCQATIDGKAYTFERHRSGDVTQHSGSTGLQKQLWQVTDHGADHVTLQIDLPDGLGGFPGNRLVTAQYQITGAALRLTVTATTDAPTLMNPANHSYWALDPELGFAGHVLTVHADHFTEAGPDLVPTGQVLPVTGTPYDFRAGKVLAGDDSQFYDINLCLSDTRRPLRPVATLRGTSGVELTMSTTECGLQVYDCGTIRAPDFPTHHDQPYMPYSGVALEAQSWPGAVAHDHFPRIHLYPGAVYSPVTEWEFINRGES